MEVHGQTQIPHSGMHGLQIFFVIDNIIPEHAALFLLGRLPMESGGDQDDDVCIRISFADFL